ncbi:MAG: hypothetical protein ABI640_02105 [Gammaproteobacteria bacterium]
MRTIFLGNAQRRDQWLQALRRFGRADLAATVGSSDRAGSGNIPEFSSLQDALAHTPAHLAIVSGCATAAAIDAAERGLAVILEDPSSSGAAELRALRDAAARRERAVTLVCATNRYARRARLLRQFLTTGRLGAIGHVSCVDHRSSAGNASSPEASTQLVSVGCGHLMSVQALVATRPLNVMAELTARSPQDVSTAAFVELEQGVHIQYFGSVGSGPDHHELWIEGTGGSLRTDGGNVLWRKRGWRFFVPLRFSLGRIGEDKDTARLAALAKVETAGKAPADSVDALALASAAIQSNEMGCVVPLAGAVPR